MLEWTSDFTPDRPEYERRALVGYGSKRSQRHRACARFVQPGGVHRRDNDKNIQAALTLLTNLGSPNPRILPRKSLPQKNERDYGLFLVGNFRAYKCKEVQGLTKVHVDSQTRADLALRITALAWVAPFDSVNLSCLSTSIMVCSCLSLFLAWPGHLMTFQHANTVLALFLFMGEGQGLSDETSHPDLFASRSHADRIHEAELFTSIDSQNLHGNGAPERDISTTIVSMIGRFPGPRLLDESTLEVDRFVTPENAGTVRLYQSKRSKNGYDDSLSSALLSP